jgi:hypothetical protein
MHILRNILALCLSGTAVMHAAAADAVTKAVANDDIPKVATLEPEPVPADRGFGTPGDIRCSALFLDCNATAQANLAQFTSDPADPSFTCRIPSAGRGFNTAWYFFIAQNPTAILSTGSVSGGAANDTLLAVYSGDDCGVVTQIACDDDSGPGNFSLINLTGLTIGKTYYVQLAAYSAAAVGTYSLSIDCRPTYDECSGALTLNCNSSTEVNLGICTTAPGDPIFACATGGGPVTQGFNSAWLKFTAGHPNMRLTAIATNGAGSDNTLMQAFIGTGCGNLGLFACNDDAGPGGLSRLDFSGITVGREFWVMIAAKTPADVDKYRVLLECNPDCATCPPGAVQENEACGFSTNGACTSGTAISCGSANICGELSPAFGSTPADVDLYSFTLDVASVVNWCVVSPQNIQIAITSFPFCPSSTTPIIYAVAEPPSCEPGCVSYIVPAGTYMVGVAPLSSAFTCGGGNNYTATFSTSIYCPGNLNEPLDFAIDTADLVRFLGRFGQPVTSDCSGADLVKNGAVDTADLVRFLGRFGGLCLPPPPPPGQ